MTLNMKPKNLTFKGHLQHNDLNSKQLLQQLLANQHRVQNLSAYMIHLTSNWDIQKAWQIEKAQTRRLRQAAEVKFAKAILQCIDVKSLDDFGIVDKELFQVALLNSFNSLWQPNIKDFDFDNSSNKLYLDIQLPWIASTVDGIVTDKWCTLSPRTHRFEMSHFGLYKKFGVAKKFVCK